MNKRPLLLAQRGLGAVQPSEFPLGNTERPEPMTKLTDTQLIVLSSAAKHDEGLATRPANLNAAAAMKVAASLINKGLMREIRTKADAPVWHENDDGRFALKITKAGRDAIGVDEGEEDAAPASPNPGSAASKKGALQSGAKKDAKTTAAQKKGGRQKAGDAVSTPPSTSELANSTLSRS